MRICDLSERLHEPHIWVGIPVSPNVASSYDFGSEVKEGLTYRRAVQMMLGQYATQVTSKTRL